MNQFLVAYDIFNMKRLLKVKRVAYSYSLGGQRSALEAPLSESYMQDLIGQLRTLIKEEDKINIVKFLDTPILLGKSKHIAYENKGVIII
jgi:CRISPR-associated endonuclease Cas2